MPTYDYKCKECGEVFEEFQSMSSDLLVICPSCGKPSLVRLMGGGAGLVFKGTGFYLTDYKKTGSSTSSNSSSNPKSESSSSKNNSDTTPSSDASKSDTKPAPSSSSPPKSDQ